MLNSPDPKEMRFLETLAAIHRAKGHSFSDGDVHRFASAMQVLRNIESRMKANETT